MGPRLDSLEKRGTDGFSRMDEEFAWTSRGREEQFEWISQRFDAVDEQFAQLTRALEGVIDEGVIDDKLPVIGQLPSGPPATGRIAGGRTPILQLVATARRGK